MSSMARRARYHHGDLRRALLDTALAVLAEDGAAALSLREVARRAGVSHQAPYSHFADKAALVAAVAAEGFDQLASRMEAAAERAGPDPVARLRAIGLAYVRFARERRAHYQIMFSGELEAQAAPSETHAGARAFNLLLGAVAACNPPGEPFAEAVAAWALVHGLASLWLSGPLAKMSRGHATLDVLAAAVTNAFTRGFTTAREGSST